MSKYSDDRHQERPKQAIQVSYTLNRLFGSDILMADYKPGDSPDRLPAVNSTPVPPAASGVRYCMPSTLLRCLTGIALTVVLSSADDQPPQTGRVIATVNGEGITSAQLDDVVRTQLEDLEQRARQLRQAALNKLIDNLLLEQAARNAGMDTVDYLRRKVESVEVSSVEVDQAFVA